jgi:fibronectin-binding autotransporter adhesin
VATYGKIRQALAWTIAIFVGAVYGQSAGAAIYSWNTTGGTAWNVGTNWSGTVPGGADVGQFNYASYSFPPTLTAPATVGGIWDAGSAAISISGSALTINGTNINGNAGTGIEMDSGAGALTISSSIVLGGAQTWVNNSGSLLSVSNNVANGGFLLTVAGSSNTSIGNLISGGGGLTMNGGGVLTLGPSGNTYTGVTTVNSGTLSVNGPNAASGGIGTSTSIIVNNGGTILIGSSGNAFVGSTPSATNFFQINAGGLVTEITGQTNHLEALVLNGGTLSETGAASAYGNYDLQHGVSTPGSGLTSYIVGGNAALNETNGTVFNIGAGDTVIVASALQRVTQSSIVDTGLIKTGPGALFLTLANTYTASTTVTAGTLALNFGAAGAPASNIINNTTNKSVLVMNGGQLAMLGGSGSVNSQQFNGLTINPASNSSFVATEVGGGTLSASFGAITRSTTGGTIDFTLPTNGFLTTSSVTVNNGVLVNAATNWADFATVGQTTWASLTVSGGTGTIGAFPTAGYTQGSSSASYSNASFSTHIDATQGVSLVTPANGYTIGDVRFNTPGVGLNISGILFDNAGGILVTSSGSGCNISGGSLGAAGGAEIVLINYANQFFLNSVVANSPVGTSLTVGGTGTTFLTANNTYSGVTNIENGATLQFGNSGATGSPGTGAINDNGVMVFALSNAVTIGNTIKGTGSLVDSVSGSMTLTASNTFSGGFTVTTAQAVLVASSSALGTGPLMLNAGTLSSASATSYTLPSLLVLGGSQTLGNVINNGALTFSATAPGTLTSNTQLTLNSPVTINEPLSGAGFSLTKIGSGNLTIGGANTFSGGMNINAGTLTINGAGGANGPFVNSAITVAPAAELDLNVNDSMGYNSAGLVTIYGLVKKLNNQSETLGRPILLSGGTMTTAYSTSATANGGWNFNNNSISTAIGTNNYINGTQAFDVRAAQCYFNLGSSSTLTISVPVGQYGGSNGGLNLQGSGLLLLTASNTYTATTNVSGGTLQLGTGGSTGNLGGGSVTDNGTIVFDTSYVGLAVPNAVSGSGSFALIGSGLTIISNSNSYGGGTSITAGTLQLGSPAAIGTGGVAVNGGSTLDLYGNSQSIGAVNFVRGNIVSSVGSPTLTGTSYTVQSGSISVPLAGSTAALSMTGTGLVTLSAANTYGGPTTISSGTLQLGTGVSGQDGSIAGTSGLTVNSAVVYNIFSNQTPGYGISGSGSLTKAGPGVLVLGPSASYTGATNVTGGGLYIDTSLSSTAAVTVAGGTTLGGSGSVGPVTVSPNATIDLSANGSNTFTVSSLNFSNQGLINIPILTNTSSLALADIGSLTPNGRPGTVQLAFNNLSFSNGLYRLLSYGSIGGTGTSAFTISSTYPPATGNRQNYALQSNGHEIDLNISGSTPYWNGQQSDWMSTGAWTLNPGGTLTTFEGFDNDVFDDSASTGEVGTAVTINQGNANPISAIFNNNMTAYTISGSNGITGPAYLIVNGTGSVTINNSNSYSGGTILSAAAGQLNINNPSALGTGPLSINGGTLGNNSSGSVALAANNSQIWNGSFAFVGPNDLNLGSGSVQLATSSAVTVTAGNLTVGGPISGAGMSLTLNVAGTSGLTLSGANTYNSGTFILGGNITAAGNSPLGSGPVLMNPSAGTAKLLFTGAAPTIGTLSNGGAGTSSIVLGNAANSSPTQLTINEAGATTFSGTIGDLSLTNSAAVGSIVVAGGGTLNLPTANTYTGSTTLSGGLTVVSNAAAVPGPLVMNGGGLQTTAGTVANNIQFNNAAAPSSFNTAGGNNMTLSGNLTGSGTAAVVGGGSLYLANSGASGVAFVLSAGTVANVSAGTLTVALGALSGNGSVLGNNDLSGGQVTYVVGALNGSSTYGGIITDSVGGGGTTAIDLVGGSLALTANNTYSGGTTVNSGTLVLNPRLLNNGAGFPGSGTLTINPAATVASYVNGFGTVPANLIPVVINGGVLTQLSADSHLGAVTMTGGTISGTTFDPHFGFTTLPSSNPSVISAALNMQASNTFNVGLGSNSPDLLVSGVISGGFGITKSGSGLMVTTASNTYTGTTTITAGTLQMMAAPVGNAAGASSGTISIAAGATFNAYTQYAPAIVNGAGVWNYNPGATMATAGNFQPTSGNVRSFTGTMNILSGNRYWPNSENLIPAGPIVIANGGQLGDAFNGTLTANLFIAGSSWNLGANGGDNNGALRLGSGNGNVAGSTAGTFAGTLTLDANAGVAVNAGVGGGGLGNSGTGTISALISDLGQGYQLTIVNGTIHFNQVTGNNSFGSLNISPSTCAIAQNGYSAAFGGGGLVSNGTAEINGSSISVANLTGSGLVINGYGQLGYMTVGTDSTSTTFPGTIADGAGAASLAVTKVGTGTLTLTGTNNSYSGDTTVDAGMLYAGAINTLSLYSSVTVNSGTLDVTTAPQSVNALSIGSSGVLNLYLANPLTSVNAASFAAGSSLNLSGSVTTLPELLMTYAGMASGTFSNVSLNGAALPATDLSYLSGSLELVGTASAGPVVWASPVSGNWSAGTNWIGGVAPNGVGAGAVINAPTSSQLTVTLDAPQTVGSLLLGNSGGASPNTVGYTLLDTTGTNTLTLNNSGSGATITVTDGSHVINAAVILADNLTLSPAASSTLAILGNISQTGGTFSLTMSNSGELILSGSNSYGGGTFVTAGILLAASPAALPGGSNLTVGQGASTLFSPAFAAPSAVPGAMVAVPEPGTLALFATGAVLLLLFRKLERLVTCRKKDTRI